MGRGRIAFAILVCAACGGGAASKPACIDAGTHPIGRVGACELSEKSVRWAMAIRPGTSSDQRVPLAVSWLIDRELFAQGALDAGEKPPSADEVMQRLAKGELVLFGGPAPRMPWADDQGGFDGEKLRQYAASMGLTVDELVAEQGRERLAQAMIQRLATKPEDEPKIEAWVARRCREQKAAGAIQIDAKLAPGYQPCS